MYLRLIPLGPHMRSITKKTKRSHFRIFRIFWVLRDSFSILGAKLGKEIVNYLFPRVKVSKIPSETKFLVKKYLVKKTKKRKTNKPIQAAAIMWIATNDQCTKLGFSIVKFLSQERMYQRTWIQSFRQIAQSGKVKLFTGKQPAILISGATIRVGCVATSI